MVLANKKEITMHNTIINNDELNKLNNEAVLSTAKHFSKLLTKQLELVQETANRAINRTDSLVSINTSEAAVDFQRSTSNEELSEIKKAGVECYKLGEEAVNDFVKIAEKNQEFWEKTINEATNKVFSSLPQVPNNFANTFSFAKQAFENTQNMWQKNYNSVRETQATVLEKPVARKK